MRKVFIFGLLFLSALILLFGKDFWEKKPYTQWSREEALRILQDSPWTKNYREGGAVSPYDTGPRSSPGAAGTGGAPSTGSSSDPTSGGTTGTPRTESTFPDPSLSRGGSGSVYFISWYSATPVRQALVRLSQLKGSVPEEQANATLNAPQPNYIIAVSGNDLRLLENVSPEEMKKLAYLKTSSGQDKVYISEYMPPSSQRGQSALFIFPKEVNGHPVLTDKDKEVTFNLELKGKPIRAKFRTKDTVYNGKLDL